MSTRVKGTSFNFCGLDSLDDLHLTVNEIKRPIGPTATEHVQDIPGMYGNLNQGMSYGAKTITIDCTLEADSKEQAIERQHDLADVLIHFGASELPMVFSDESEWTYFGHVSNISEPAKVTKGADDYSFTITFTCSDPYVYGETRQNIKVTSNPQKFIPDGTAEIYPIFTCIPKKSITQIAVTDSDGHFAYVGDKMDPDTKLVVTNLEPRVFWDQCNDLSKWTIVTGIPTFNLENGVIGGTMRTTGNVFKVGDVKGDADFGKPSKDNWHGPVIQRYLDKTLSNYRIRARMYNNQYYARSMGKCELYLLDENGVRVGKLMLKDNGNSKEVYAQAQVGDTGKGHYKDIYYGLGKVKKGKETNINLKTSTGTTKVKVGKKTKTEQVWKTINRLEDSSTSAYTNFYGYIELQKIGNKYRVEIMPMDDDSNPIQSKATVITWTDTKGEFSHRLSGIAFYTANYDITEDTVTPIVNYKNNGMGINDIKIYEILDGGNKTLDTPTEIADAGDEIKINCEDHNAYKNGALMTGLYAGSSFPKMKGKIPGYYAFEPPLEEADWYITYRPTRR